MTHEDRLPFEDCLLNKCPSYIIGLSPVVSADHCPFAAYMAYLQLSIEKPSEGKPLLGCLIRLGISTILYCINQSVFLMNNLNESVSLIPQAHHPQSILPALKASPLLGDFAT